MEKSYFPNRRTIRKFINKEVSQSLINEIVSEAIKAPTTGNMQLYSVVVTADEERRKALSELHYSQPASVNAPVMLTVCADIYRFTRWCEVSDADSGFDNFLTFLSAFSDAMIFSQQIVTIAELKGLGTCYLGTVIYNAPEIAKLLNLPKRVIPVACIALGYPDEEGEATERLATKDIIHMESYHHLRDEEVMDIYKVKESYPPNEVFVKENKKQNLAQVFSEVRYPRELNEQISAKLTDYLREEGLL